MYVRDTLTLPAKGLRPSAHPAKRWPGINLAGPASLSVRST
jgi:hypothetical protein